MKVTIDIDCTPEEARVFLGLPDVQPVQQAVMAALQDRMVKNIQAMDPEALFKAWVPAGVQGLEQVQKMFWNQFTGGKTGGKED